MKKCLLLTLAASLLVCASHAQKTVAQWANENAQTLNAIDTPALAALIRQGAPAYDALFAQIKTGGDADAVASITIAALSQFVMKTDTPKATRKVYADALLAAAQKAKDADVVCFYLDQLRWCGMPEQARAITAFTTSTEPSIAELAKVTLYAVTDDRNAKLPPVASPSACRRFNQEVARLSATARSKRLMDAFDGADDGVASAALVWMNERGNAEKTAEWTKKLATTTNPTRRIMLIDALAIRGDKTAVAAIAQCIADADTLVVKTALAALLQLDAAAFVSHFTETLKTIPNDKVSLWRDAARQVPTAQLTKPLLTGYATFNPAGQKLALELFRERRTADAIPIALAAAEAEDHDMAIAAYRVLRETGTPQHAGIILQRLPKTPGRVLSEAQGAFAAIARRDTRNTCADLLRKALQAAPDSRTVFYETAARIGGDLLLDDIEKTASSADANLSAAAIRALTAWADGSSAPALMRLALSAPDEKNQALALRGVTQKMTARNIDKPALHEQWKQIRETQGNGENKNTIDELFK